MMLAETVSRICVDKNTQTKHNEYDKKHVKKVEKNSHW